MENNEIMQRLLQDDKPSKTEEKSKGATVKANNEDISISKIRVVTAKYKVYIVLLLIFIAILLIKSIPSANDAFKGSETAYEQAKLQLTNVEKNIKIAEQDMEYLCNDVYGVVTNEETLKKCLNEDEGCSNLPESWKKGEGEDATYDFSIPLSYLQVHSLYNKKMPVDEKRVLKNLNEYLIKEDMLGGDKTRIGDILRIEIGDPEAINQGDEHFFEVPVDVEIEFETVDYLVGFLYNIEKKLIDNGEDRILYKIQSVSYDIVTNDEPQVTDISMIAYYYHDEKFNDKAECDDGSDSDDSSSEETNVENNMENNNEESSNDSDDSESFFEEIFKDLKK